MTSVSGVDSASAGALSSALTGSSGANQTADYDDFLTLLTTQMKNQDPLNPADSSAFVEQLATFSSVEQQVQMNTKLDELISQNSLLTWSELAGWVGREVTASGAGVSYEGEPLTLKVPEDADADSVKVVITDGDGEIVRTLEATMGEDLEWDGKDASGNLVDEDLYYVEYEYTAGSSEDGDLEEWSVKANGTGRVVEATISNGEVVLVLENGSQVAPADVVSIKDISSDAEEEA